MPAVARQVQGIVPAGILGPDPPLAVVGLEASEDPSPVFLEDLVVQLGLCEAHDVRMYVCVCAYVCMYLCISD